MSTGLLTAREVQREIDPFFPFRSLVWLVCDRPAGIFN